MDEITYKNVIVAVMRKILKRIFLVIGTLLLFFIVVSIALYTFTKPSLNRDWSLGQEKLAHITIDNNQQVHITNLRDFTWAQAGQVAKSTTYREKDFVLSDIAGLYVVVSHFASQDAIAHVFLVFTMKDGDDIAISVEARREKGEEFTLFGGLTAQYEFMYVVGSARDLITLRQQRHERLQRYTINVPIDKVDRLFTSLATTINNTHDEPRLYHLFFKNCVNSLTREVHRLNSDYSFSFFISSFAPGFVGEMLVDMEVAQNVDAL